MLHQRKRTIKHVCQVQAAAHAAGPTLHLLCYKHGHGDMHKSINAIAASGTAVLYLSAIASLCTTPACLLLYVHAMICNDMHVPAALLACCKFLFYMHAGNA
jgi:hypothetical protein